jgi:hypothetical protein
MAVRSEIKTVNIFKARHIKTGEFYTIRNVTS